jgi:hypothetical protein
MLPVRLPVAPGSAPPPSEHRHCGAIFIPKHRLLVDDNGNVAASLAMLFGMNGQETLTAHDGLEAVVLAEAFRPGT